MSVSALMAVTGKMRLRALFILPDVKLPVIAVLAVARNSRADYGVDTANVPL